MRIRLNHLTKTLLFLVLVIAGCGSPASQPPPTEMPVAQAPRPTPLPLPSPTPTSVSLSAVVMGAAERHNAGDLEGMMAYWADDALFYMFGMPPTGSELLQGKEQIRAMFEENIASHSRWEVEIDAITGDTVYGHSRNWHDFTRQIGVAPLEATGVYVIEDGKIAEYTWTLTEETAFRLKTALSEAMPAEPAPEPAVETPTSELTVTIAGGTCRYTGPLTLQAGEVQVTVDVQDQNKAAYAVTFLALDPGKDMIDLMATTTGDPPAWSELLHYREAGAGESITFSMTVTQGPLYAICWSQPPDHPIGNIGPFTVSSVSAAAEPLTPLSSEGPASDMIITISEGRCTYDGPQILQAGEMTVTLDVKDEDKADYALTFFNLLDPDKDFTDLMATTSMPAPPPWADMISMNSAGPGQSKTYSFTVEVGPVYLICWGADRPIGKKGPFDVTQ